MLHSSINMGLKFTRGKQTGIKKTDYILSLPEVSFCSEKNRKKRCRREPKCQHVNCLRNALERCINETVGGKRHVIELCKVRTDMMLVSSKTNLTAIQINASAHILINLWSVSWIFLFQRLESSPCLKTLLRWHCSIWKNFW